MTTYTMAQLRKVAGDLSIQGRSKMNKGDLHSAVIAALDILRDQAYDMMTSELRRKATVAKVAAGYKAKRKPGTPMSMERRINVYTAQRNGGRLTDRQRRRIGRKGLHYAARCGMISRTPAAV